MPLGARLIGDKDCVRAADTASLLSIRTYRRAIETVHSQAEKMVCNRSVRAKVSCIRR